MGAGSGMIVIGLASVIIGEVLCGRRGVRLGSVVYRIILALALRYNLMSANALRLLSAVIVAATLALPAVSAALRQQRERKENRAC